jgi:hypothetical protein
MMGKDVFEAMLEEGSLLNENIPRRGWLVRRQTSNLFIIEQTGNNVKMLQTPAHDPKWQAAIHVLQQITFTVKKI